ncbi:MAG: TRAP transporter large permease subunit [Truepera sp.]|nr:TRAP transporter large permease subunit [Truepera sp.]
MSVELLTVLMFASVIVGILLGFPIAFVLGGLAAIFGYLLFGPGIANIFMLRMFGVLQDNILIAIPLFVYMGVVLEQTGIVGRLFDTMRLLLGRLPGGLAVTTIVSATIFAAGVGVVGASIVAIGLIALPSMLKYHYNKPLATGAICAGGTLGILIPPSILIVIYGPTAGLSVGQLFMAAIGPGLLLSLLYVIYTVVVCAIKPELGPAISREEAAVPLRHKVSLFFTSVAPVAAIIVTVLGTIFFGLATPTEAAGVGAFAALLLALAYRTLNLRTLWRTVHSALRITSMIYLVILGAQFFTSVFTRMGGGRVVRDAFVGLPFEPVVVLIMMLSVVFILGMFIDWLGVIMLAVPLFTPIAAALGFEPIWFAMMVMLVLQTSFLTPPFAYAIFYLKGIAPPEVSTIDIYKGILPFVALQLLALVLLYWQPQIALWLPQFMLHR